MPFYETVVRLLIHQEFPLHNEKDTFEQINDKVAQLLFFHETKQQQPSTFYHF